MAETITLAHVNVPPAQTWNYLHVDDIAIEVPVPGTAIAPAPPAELPEAARELAGGVGAEAQAWLAASANRRRTVEVAPGEHRATPIVIDVMGEEGTIAETTVMVGEAAEATVNVVAFSAVDARRTLGSLLRIVAEKNALVHVSVLVALHDSVTYLDDIAISEADGARVEVRQFVLGAGTCALGLAADLAGKASAIDCGVRYLVRDGQRLDMNYAVAQRGRKSRALVDATGVLEGSAQKTLRATIDLVHGCKGAKGREQETVLVAGEDAVNKTLPVILCSEDDVAGDHGATIGSISPDQLAYLADRGLTEDEAVALFSRAVIDDAVAHSKGHAIAAAIAVADRVLGHQAACDLADEQGLACVHEDPRQGIRDERMA